MGRSFDELETAMFAESEVWRERAHERSLTRLIFACGFAVAVAGAAAMISGYWAIRSDPRTAKHLDVIQPVIQAFVPLRFMLDEETLDEVMKNDTIAMGAEARSLGELAPAAGPTAAYPSAPIRVITRANPDVATGFAAR